VTIAPSSDGNRQPLQKYDGIPFETFDYGGYDSGFNLVAFFFYFFSFFAWYFITLFDVFPEPDDSPVNLFNSKQANNGKNEE